MKKLIIKTAIFLMGSLHVDEGHSDKKVENCDLPNCETLAMVSNNCHLQKCLDDMSVESNQFKTYMISGSGWHSGRKHHNYTIMTTPFFTPIASFFSNKKNAFSIVENLKKKFPDDDRLKSLELPTLTESDFEVLLLAMNKFDEDYKKISANKECKKQAIDFLKETGYITGVNTSGDITYQKVEHTIRKEDAKKLLEAYKRAYVNMISDNTQKYDNHKPNRLFGGNNTAPRLRGEASKDASSKQELYPEDLYDQFDHNKTIFPAAVVNGKRSACVNGLKKHEKTISLDQFDKLFNATINGR